MGAKPRFPAVRYHITEVDKQLDILGDVLNPVQLARADAALSRRVVRYYGLQNKYYKTRNGARECARRVKQMEKRNAR